MLDLARLIIPASWVVLFGSFAWSWRRAQRGRRESGRRVERASLLGMLLEFAALALAPLFRVADPGLPGWVYAASAGLAMVSAAFGIRAGAVLGRQLRIQAVVTDEHRLITAGPYSLVRHPIYAALFGMILATALVFAELRALAVVVPVFLAGTEIRVRSEDRLLAEHFGKEFDEYRRRVRAYLPGLR